MVVILNKRNIIAVNAIYIFSERVYNILIIIEVVIFKTRNFASTFRIENAIVRVPIPAKSQPVSCLHHHVRHIVVVVFQLKALKIRKRPYELWRVCFNVYGSAR